MVVRALGPRHPPSVGGPEGGQPWVPPEEPAARGRRDRDSGFSLDARGVSAGHSRLADSSRVPSGASRCRLLRCVAFALAVVGVRAAATPAAACPVLRLGLL